MGGKGGFLGNFVRILLIFGHKSHIYHPKPPKIGYFCAKLGANCKYGGKGGILDVNWHNFGQNRDFFVKIRTFVQFLPHFITIYHIIFTFSPISIKISSNYQIINSFYHNGCWPSQSSTHFIFIFGQQSSTPSLGAAGEFVFTSLGCWFFVLLLARAGLEFRNCSATQNIF